MGLGPRLEIRTSQSLVMTPQLQQAIKLLALSNLELETYVQAEIEKNPLLESAEPGEPAIELGGVDQPPEAAPAPPTDGDPATADRLIETGDAIADAPLDADFFADAEREPGDSARGSGMGDSVGSGGATGDGEGLGDIDTLAETGRSLADHLADQAAAQLTGANLAIALYLIDHIDEAGYFTGDLAQIAEALGVSRAMIDQLLRFVQRFEPTGVGARTLCECLELQAREAGLLDRPLSRLLRNLDILARGDLATLRRLCGVRPDELSALIRTVRSLNPKPGLAFGGEPTSPVAPDVLVRRARGGWQIELNAATLPRVLVNRSYYAQLVKGAKGPTRNFLSECLQSANWLTKALDQRARTIVTVAAEIVRQQEAFFERGVRYLRPLTLRSIASAIDMHESTVSRVTAHKYMMCERGLFELRFFFTPALDASDGGDQVSTTSVKRRIEQLIAAETPDHVLSDDKLVELMRTEGFDVARRTVAKYREGLGLGSSVQRRRRLLIEA